MAKMSLIDDMATVLEHFIENDQKGDLRYLTRRNISNARKLYSRYNAQKANLVTVRRDRLEEYIKGHAFDCNYCPAQKVCELEDSWNDGPCFKVQIAYLTEGEGE